MTVEERAAKICKRHFRPGGNSTVISLEELIVEAIQAALAEHNEQCAQVAVDEWNHWEGQALDTSYGQAAADRIEQGIRALLKPAEDQADEKADA